MAMDKVTCPECKSQKVWAKGRVPSRTGPKQRYVCFSCGRTFYKPKSEPRAKVARKSKSSRKKGA